MFYWLRVFQIILDPFVGLWTNRVKRPFCIWLSVFAADNLQKGKKTKINFKKWRRGTFQLFLVSLVFRVFCQMIKFKRLGIHFQYKLPEVTHSAHQRNRNRNYFRKSKQIKLSCCRIKCCLLIVWLSKFINLPTTKHWLKCYHFQHDNRK